MVNQGVVRVKLNGIENNLQRLKEKRNISLAQLKRSADLQDIILHNLQLAIQGCIDLAGHIISDAGWPAPDTLAGLFDVLAAHKIISSGLRDKLKKMAGFRNIIVHEYGSVDLDLVYRVLKRDVKDIYLFLKAVCVYAKL